MKLSKWWIAAGVVVILAGMFWGLNFHVSVSNTLEEHQSFTSSMGKVLPTAMANREDVLLVVEGNGPLAAALRTSLPAALQKVGVNARLVETERGAQPVMVVRVPSTGVFWTPVYGSSQFTVKAAYSSDGKLAFIDDPADHLDNLNGPAKHMKGDYKTTDRSWGILSYPGYYQILADGLSPKLAQSIADLYKE